MLPSHLDNSGVAPIFGGTCGGMDPSDRQQAYSNVKAVMAEGVPAPIHADYDGACRALARHDWDYDKMLWSRDDKWADYYGQTAAGLTGIFEANEMARRAGLEVPDYYIRDFCEDAAAEYEAWRQDRIESATPRVQP